MIPPKAPPSKTLAEVELDYIREVITATGGNKALAVKILGINYTTLWRKLKRHKELRTATVAAYSIPSIIPPVTSKKVTVKRKKIAPARQEEIEQYIEEIYDSLHTP